MQETTFLRIVTIILLLFSLWVAYTKEGFIHDNTITGNTMNTYVNMTVMFPNQTQEKCDCNKGWYLPYYYTK